MILVSASLYAADTRIMKSTAVIFKVEGTREFEHRVQRLKLMA